MDSKQKDDKCGIQSNTLSLVLLTILLLLIAELTNYAKVYGENKIIQCINLNGNLGEYPNEESKAVYMANTYDNNYSLVAENKDNNIVDLNNKLELNIDNINRNVNGFAITIENENFGYVLSEEEKSNIIKSICESYVREIGVNAEDISYMQINGKIKATPYEVRICQLSDSNEISKEIYEASMINNNLLNLKLSLKTSEEEVIEPPIIIQNDDSIYMGEEIVLEGQEGHKDVYKEVVYEGLKKVDEIVLNENILVEPVATVVRKGSKNPYYDGITFLGRPLKGGYISSYYGENRITSNHKGLDIANNLGEDVMASFEGKVISAGYNNGGYGNLVIIQHSDDMKTYYAHLNDIYVSEGQQVKKGEVIGEVGSTGYSTGPHLHFELRVNEKPVNPLNYIISK